MQKLLNEMMIRVTTHDSKLNDKAHGHHTVQTLNSNLMFIDIGFTTEIPRLSEYEAIENDTKTIQCYTDGSKMNDKVGAGVYIVDNDTPTCEESYHLGTNSTVFQAETFAVGTAAKILLDSGTKNRKIIINCDSQATIMAMSNIKVKSKSTSTAISELNQLAMDNQVLLRWIPAHKGYDGNEKADSLAKKGSDNLDSAQVQLPIPKVLWKGALRSISHRKMRERWRTLPNTHFKRVWRQKFARSIPKLGKESTRTATQFLTGHCELNYHINKYKPTTVPKTCPHCLMEEETMNHFIGQCPKWSYQRGGYFDSFYLSVTDIVDKFSLPRIIGFIQATKRFTKCGKDKV